jgi:O-antigen/teichoic acid export membrane protein
VRESRTLGSVGAKAKWLSYPTNSRSEVPGDSSMRALPGLTLGQAAIVSVGVDFAIVLATLFVTPFLVGRLGVEPYGIVGMVSVLAGQLSVLQFGIGAAVTRLVAEHRGRGDSVLEIATVRSAIVLGSTSGVLVGVVFAAVAPWMWTQALTGTNSALAMALGALVPSALVVAAQPLVAVVTGTLLGQERFAVLGVFRLVHGLARLGLPVLVVCRGGGVGSVLAAQAAADGVAVLSGTAAVWGADRGSAGLRESARKILAIGLPFALAGALAALLVDGEKIAVGMSRSLEEFTYYSVPFNAAYRLTALASALSLALLPRVASAVAGGQSQAAADLARRATRVTVGGMALVLAPLIGIVPELLGLWLGEPFAARASLPSRIVLVGLLANTAAFTANAVVRAASKPAVLTVLYACELPLHLATVWVLVLLLGPTGAALAWGVRVLLDAGMQRWLAGRALGTPVGSVREILLPLLALAGLALGSGLLGDAVLAARAVASSCLGAIIWATLWTAEDRKLVFGALRPVGRSVA